jgi:hypothetical protein
MKMEVREAIPEAHAPLYRPQLLNLGLYESVIKGLMYKKGVRNYISKNCCPPPAVRMKRLAPCDDKRAALHSRMRQVRDLRLIENEQEERAFRVITTAALR